MIAHCTKLRIEAAGPVSFSMASFLRERCREGKGEFALRPHGRDWGGSSRSRNSASNAARLSADETIRTRLPIASISRPNSNGAAACAIRAGAPIRPRR